MQAVLFSFWTIRAKMIVLSRYIEMSNISYCCLVAKQQINTYYVSDKREMPIPYVRVTLLTHQGLTCLSRYCKTVHKWVTLRNYRRLQKNSLLTKQLQSLMHWKITRAHYDCWENLVLILIIMSSFFIQGLSASAHISALFSGDVSND